MYLKRKANTFYIYTSLFVIAGWLWLLWSLESSGADGTTVCIFKNITGYPCPACGSTTSVEMIAKGNFAGAFGVNPLGYLMAAGLLVLPLWLIVDIIYNRRTMYEALRFFNKKAKEKPFVLVFILIAILLNWIWHLN